MNAKLNHKALARKPAELKVRRPKINPLPDDDPLYYFYDDPFISAMLTAFSGGIPELERQFIHSMRLFQEHIKDPVLQKEVRAFIGQEAHHSKEHKQINEFFEDAGFDMTYIDKQMGNIMLSWRNKYSAKQQLAYTVCLEHFTALLSDFALRKRPDAVEHASETMQKLWTWHLIEEAEHKSVAYDLYTSTVNEPLRLRLTMTTMTAFMLGFNGYHTWRLIRETGEARNIRSLGKGAAFLFGRRGMFTSMFKDYLDFYRPNFHPWDHDNRIELAEWKTRFISDIA